MPFPRPPKKMALCCAYTTADVTNHSIESFYIKGEKPQSFCPCWSCFLVPIYTQPVNNPSAHPSYSHYYLLSPSTLFFFSFFFCTSYCFFCTSCCFFAHLIVFCTSYCFLHILLFCTFLFHCTFYSYFSFSYHMYALVLCYLYNLYSYCFALSTERTWFDCISLLVMPCITIMWQIK